MSTATSRQNELARVVALLQQGQAGTAEQACRRLLATQPQDAAAQHLLGLIREQAGDPAEAERLLRASVAARPRDAQFLLNLAHFQRRRARHAEAAELFRRALAVAPGERTARRGLALTLADLGDYAAAESECRKLVDGDARDGAAWTLLGFVLNRLDRLVEAEAAYRRALALDPRDALACHNLGALASRLERAEEALELLDRAGALGVGGVELLVNRGRTLALLYRLDEAERSFAEAIARQPTHIDAQTNLAKLRYMRGDPGFDRAFAAATAAHPGDARLAASLATILRCAGRHDAGQRALRAALEHHGGMPELRALLAQALLEAGEPEAASHEALAAAAARPDDAAVIETLVASLLCCGRAAESLPHIEAWRQRQPAVQTWIAYQATAARLLGRAEYAQLFDYATLVRGYEIATPAGWASVAEFNAALLERLGARHRAAVQPLDQSLRHGSQTMRNLLAETDPIIVAALQAFAEPIQAYLRELGHDAGHPLRERNRGAARIAGAWSVQLRREGYHVNHIHPEGWISSAYYVAVPEEVADPARRSGWIKFGESRYPVPGMTPGHFVQPRAGMLVLFPSYMWHGTTPIHGAEPRTTIAFDSVPATS
ncbi:MAG: putative 2OG-Fe(II) oxygenase [Steroidobacteraceae bacterium]